MVNGRKVRGSQHHSRNRPDTRLINRPLFVCSFNVSLNSTATLFELPGVKFHENQPSSCPVVPCVKRTDVDVFNVRSIDATEGCPVR